MLRSRAGARLPGRGAALPARRTRDRGCSTAPRSTPACARPRCCSWGCCCAGASGVASGYLYGRGRPGLNSLGLGLGLVATVALDLALIPTYGALGAAVASSMRLPARRRRAGVASCSAGAPLPDPAARSGDGRPGGVVVSRLRRTGLALVALTTLVACGAHRPAGGADVRTAPRRPGARRRARPAGHHVDRPLPASGRAAARPKGAGLVRDRPGRSVARRADHVPPRRTSHGGACPVPRHRRLQGRRRARLPRRPDLEGAGARASCVPPGPRWPEWPRRHRCSWTPWCRSWAACRDDGPSGATCARDARATSPGATSTRCPRTSRRGWSTGST